MRFFILASVLFAISCGSSTRTYVGSVSQSDVAVGVIDDGTHMAVFFCGGSSSVATTTKWFRFNGDESSFTQTLSGWTIVGSGDGTIVIGTIDRNDGQGAIPWSASRTPDDSLAGLYESIDDTGTSGVIVQNDTSMVQGAFIDKVQNIEQIIPIFPLDFESQGLHVTINGQDAFVPRASPTLGP